MPSVGEFYGVSHHVLNTVRLLGGCEPLLQPLILAALCRCSSFLLTIRAMPGSLTTQPLNMILYALR